MIVSTNIALTLTLTLTLIWSLFVHVIQTMRAVLYQKKEKIPTITDMFMMDT
jgi:hypothetical protein